jgi:hypothetical protein
LNLDINIPVKEIERRKNVIRDIWDYKFENVDHIPVQTLPILNSQARLTKKDLQIKLNNWKLN